MPAGSQIVVLGGGEMRRQKVVQDVLRVVADSIGKSVVALRQLLIMVALCNRADHYIFILFLMAALCNRGAIIFLPCSFFPSSSSSSFFFFFLA